MRSIDGRVFWEARLSDNTGRSEIDRLNDLDGILSARDNSIYAVNYQGAVAQIDPKSGERRWSVEVSSAVGLDVNDTTVIITDEFDSVWALSLLDGQLLWKHEGLSNRLLTAPAFTSDGDVLVGDYEGYLHVLSGANGAQIGRIRAVTEQITHKPVLVENTVYVLGRSGKLAAVSL